MLFQKPKPVREYWRSCPASAVSNADQYWRVVEPTEVGFDAKILAQHRDLCRETSADAYLVVYKGAIVSEGYGPRYSFPMYTMSSVKSWTGLLVGLLVDDGRIASIDDPVHRYIPEWKEGRKSRVTLRHLMSMTAGFNRKIGMKRGPDQSVGAVGDKNRHVINLPLSYEPGTKWEYSNEGVQLLSPILDKAAGEPIQDYARRRLFSPLGMKDTALNLDAKGHAWTYADAKTTPRDFARIGMLMINKGVWGTKRILSEDWIRIMLQPGSLNPRYGLLWWLFPGPKGYGTLGYLDTNCMIFTKLDLVIVRMQNTPGKEEDSAYLPKAFEIFERLEKL